MLKVLQGRIRINIRSRLVKLLLAMEGMWHRIQREKNGLIHVAIDSSLWFDLDRGNDNDHDDAAADEKKTGDDDDGAIPAQQATTSGLGEEWQIAVDPSTGASYYYNSQTGETLWVYPSAASTTEGEVSRWNDVSQGVDWQALALLYYTQQQQHQVQQEQQQQQYYHKQAASSSSHHDYHWWGVWYKRKGKRKVAHLLFSSISTYKLGHDWNLSFQVRLLNYHLS